MKALKRHDLYSLEEYSNIRDDFRKKVMEHKKTRRVPIGAHTALYFENQLMRGNRSIKYNEELETYNPLIPDGRNLKATFMIEYSDKLEIKQALKTLRGIEKKIWIKIGDCESIYPITNEDLERETKQKTSAVHFLRFEFSPDMIKKANNKANVSIGIDHKHYNEKIDSLAEPIRQSLVNDFYL